MNCRSIILLLMLWANPIVVFNKSNTSKHTARLPLISAHRGASHYAPENTLAAFSKAIAMGAHFLEVDIRTTLDGIQVCLHDGSLKRTTGVEKKVRDCTFKEISLLSAGDWFDEGFTGERIPTLEALCRLVRSENKQRLQHVKLYIDCKDIRERAVLQILKDYNLLDSAVFYGDKSTLFRIKTEYASARLMPPWPGRENADSLIRSLKPYAFDVSWDDMSIGVVNYCHEKKIKVFSDLLGEYDTAKYYRKAMEMNIDVIQTDNITAVQEEMYKYKRSR